MEVTFKNTAAKGKQCEQFLSIIKKLRLHLSNKDKRVYFYVDKRSFLISTFALRNLEDPPANSPSNCIEYSFSRDFYKLSRFTGQNPYIFCFDIDELVKMFTNFIESKMTTMRLVVDEKITSAHIQFTLNQDQYEGFIKLNIQKIHKFSFNQDIKKQNVKYINFFQIKADAEKLDKMESFTKNCWYKVHQNGLYFQIYGSQNQQNTIFLQRQNLKDFNPQLLKKQLNNNIFILQPQNYLVNELILCTKKNYQYIRGRLILIRHPQNTNLIRHCYLQITCKLSLFQQSYKKLICRCQISQKASSNLTPIIQNVSTVDIMKNQQHQIQALRRVIVNKWAKHHQVEYAQLRDQEAKNKIVIDVNFVQNMFEQTNTRKNKFKFQS